MKNKKIKCDIYTRVSTTMQVDGYSLDAQKEKLVLVFKLSRFGRNAADVLNSLQKMQDFGVNLICVEDSRGPFCRCQ